MNYVVYNSSGDILRSGTCPPDVFEAQAGENEFVLEWAGQVDDETQCVNVATQQVVEK